MEISQKYPKRFLSKLSNFEILNASSVELFFKKDSIKSKGVLFDENFGLGSTFTWEKKLFLFSDAIKTV